MATPSRLTSAPIVNTDTGGVWLDGGRITSDGSGNITATSVNGAATTNVIFPQSYGAKGNGINNDTSAIQAAFFVAGLIPGSTVQFSTGVYMVNATLTFPGQTKIIGAGDADNGTVIRVITGSALTTPIMASQNWYNNASTCDYPVAVSDIKFDGNSAMSGATGHGFVLMNYWSSVDRCTFTGVSGDGFLLSAFNRGGTHISNTCVEAKLSRLQVRTCGGTGIHVYDDGTTLNSCTDGFLQDCIVTGAGTTGILVEMAPGWFVMGNHIYGTGIDAMYLKRCYSTRCIGNYIDGYGTGSATYIAGIAMDCLDGRASVCIGNVVGYESSTATGPYQSIRITGAGSAATYVTVHANSVNGNNGSGSLGYVIQANSSQQAYPWIVDFVSNRASNVSNYSYLDTYTVFADTAVGNHINSIGTTPTVVAGANAGTSPPVPVKTNCTDISGKITFGTGTTPAAGIQVSVTFAQSYAAYAPAVTVTPVNSGTAALNCYIAATSSGFTLSTVTAPSASQANTIYGFNYHVIR